MHPQQRHTVTTTGESVPDAPHLPPPAPPNGPSQLPANGAELDQVEAAVWVEALKGVEAVLALAPRLPPGATRDVLLHTLPEEWRNGLAVSFLQRITDADAAMLLAWLGRHWWEAYGMGQSHHEVGQDLRAVAEKPA